MKVLFSTLSFLQKFRTWGLRLFFIFLISICLINIKENAFIIIIMITAFLIFLVLINDKFVWSKMYFFNLYAKNKTFNIKDIKKVESNINTLVDEVFVIFSKYHLSNYLWIYLLDGSNVTLTTSINESELIEITEIVNNLIRQNEENLNNTNT